MNRLCALGVIKWINDGIATTYSNTENLIAKRLQSKNLTAYKGMTDVRVSSCQIGNYRLGQIAFPLIK